MAEIVEQDPPGPPPFLSAAGHPLRWRLLGELARSDRQVQELTAALGQPQNLVSYHLGKLRRASLVTARRSSADRRDTYYALDLAQCARLLAETGAVLHAGLRMTAPPLPVAPASRILFLCTGNSSRSQMAEAFLRRRTGSASEICSAGSHPKPIHPHAVTAMAAWGVDLSGARSKHLDEFTGREFDYVISLCDRVREICPEFPGHPRSVHWCLPDPSADPDGLPAFARAAGEIRERVDFLLYAIADRALPAPAGR